MRCMALHLLTGGYIMVQSRKAIVDQYLTLEDVADHLQLNVQTVRRYVREKRLTAIRLGKSYRVHKDDLRRFIEGSKA